MSRVFHREATSLARAGYEVILVAANARAETVQGVRIIPLPEKRTLFQRYVCNNVCCLWQGLRIRADVYHFHDPELIPVGMLLRLLGKRVIYDAHEDYVASLASHRFHFGLRHLALRPGAPCGGWRAGCSATSSSPTASSRPGFPSGE